MTMSYMYIKKSKTLINIITVYLHFCLEVPYHLAILKKKRYAVESLTQEKLLLMGISHIRLYFRELELNNKVFWSVGMEM